MVELAVAKRLGKFELEECLGSSGLASVYRARDTLAGRWVALKVLHSYFTQDRDLLEGFLAELDRVRALDHPNILPVYEYGEDDGTIWISMEHTSERSLRELVSGQVDLKTAVYIVEQLAGALEHAHARGVYHRNIKPSNVLLSPDGKVLLTDFAMAALGENVPFSLKMGLSTPMPSFMSPEQAGGNPVDQKSDVYALGVLLYWMLTGTLPFYGSDSSTIYAKQLNYAPLPPSTENPQLPKELDRIVLKALAPFTAIRYNSPTELVEQLRSVVTAPPELPLADTNSGISFLEAQGGVLWNRPVHHGLEEEQSAFAPRELLLEKWWALHEVAPKYRPGVIFLSTLALLLLSGLTWMGIGQVKANVSFLPPTASAASVDTSPGQWASMRRDPLNNGNASGVSQRFNGEIKWVFKGKPGTEPIYATPAVDGNRVYIPTGDRRLVALDTTTGNIVWEYALSGPVDASPAVANGIVYLGLRDKRLLAIDAQSGEFLWAFVTDNPIMAPATVVDGVVYIGSGDGRIYALDATTSELRWSFDTGNWINGGPVVNDEIVAVGSRSGGMYVLRKNTGAPLLYSLTGGEITTSPSMADGTIYFGSDQGRFWALDTTARDTFLVRQRKWIELQLFLWGLVPTPGPPKGTIWMNTVKGKSKKDNVIFSSPAVADGTVYVGASNGSVYAWDAPTGEMKWEFKAGGPVLSSPAVAGNVLYVGSDDGKVYALDAATGHKLWELATGGKIQGSPAVGADAIFIASFDGNMYAIH